MDHQRFLSGDGGLRRVSGRLRILRNRNHKFIPVPDVQVRPDPRRRRRSTQPKHGVLLPVWLEPGPGVQLQNSTFFVPHQLRSRGRSWTDRVDQLHPPTHCPVKLRRFATPGGLVVRRLQPAAVGHVWQAGGAAGEPAAVDGDAGKPRGGEDPGPPFQAVHFVQRQVADAVRGERVGFEPLLLVPSGRGPRGHAGVVH